MGVVAGAVITGVAALSSAGIQAWFNNRAQEQNLKEHRRSENLQIKLAADESKREEGRFSRNLGLQKEQLEFGKANAVVSHSQNQMNGIMNMFNNNRKLSDQLIQSLRGRR